MAKKRRKKRRRKSGGIFILILLFIVAVVVALTTPVFNIASVTVTGNERLTAEEVRDAADIVAGANIFRTNLKNVTRRIEKIPYVDTATVRRKFPDKITIAVTECVGVAAVKCGNGYAVIDAKGKVLEAATSPGELCEVRGMQVRDTRAGEVVSLSDDRLLGVVTTLLQAMDKHALHDIVAACTVNSTIDVSLETKGGMTVQLGSLEELDYKLDTFQNILCGGYEDVTKDSGGVLNVTNPEKVSYRRNPM